MALVVVRSHFEPLVDGFGFQVDPKERSRQAPVGPLLNRVLNPLLRNSVRRLEARCSVRVLLGRSSHPLRLREPSMESVR